MATPPFLFNFHIYKNAKTDSNRFLSPFKKSEIYLCNLLKNQEKKMLKYTSDMSVLLVVV